VAQKLILYNYWRSSSSYRVRIALRLKALDFEYRPVHLVKEGGQQYHQDFVKMNPKAEVPFLVDGSFGLSQSMAILDYLEGKFKGRALLPSSLEDRARCLEICEIINSGMQPLHNLRVLQKLEKEAGYSEEQKKAWIQFWILGGLRAIEPLIQKYSGGFCLGSSPTLADLCLVPQVYTAHRFAVDLSDFPRVKAVNEHCLKLSEFADSAPEKQIDANL
jgi:maleylacetoacetate isomerase